MAQPADTVMKKIFVSVATAVILGCLGFGWNSYQKRWADQLETTGNQINDLYGPLLYQVQANTQVWNSFNHYKNTIAWSNLNKIPAQQKLQWKHWMETVFQPQNLLMKKTIEENSRLFLDARMPPVFSQLIEHTNAYTAVISGWEADEEPNLTTWIVFPNNFESCVKQSYEILQKAQQKLQRMIFPRTVVTPAVPDICEKRDLPVDKYPEPPV